MDQSVSKKKTGTRAGASARVLHRCQSPDVATGFWRRPFSSEIDPHQIQSFLEWVNPNDDEDEPTDYMTAHVDALQDVEKTTTSNKKVTVLESNTSVERDR
eukprot:6633715-Pyramimonas_sp.AAC.1